jgi:flagellar protein FliO/FliZ
MPTTTDTDSILLAVAAFLFAFAVIALIAWAFKTFMLTGRSGGSFLKGRERRLGVVESAAIDSHRKLILIRRDNVEHLIMTGGPVDVVIETGIEGHRHLEPPLEDVVIARTDARQCRTWVGPEVLARGVKLQIFQYQKLDLDCDTPATVVLLVRRARLR